ncbi:hypothetical protein NliqN6_2286 [Naganishia liquefaciens]|uniref:Uncharacterized protein n=1 Tax=Naganishia liquefaciens TaxID=104408 RepID=A0A8H3YDZ3_9TREE|nr:hypothetical protein NliqN6_2286 [Naganishia liquefaciens]
MPDGKKVPKSRHLVWYREIVPATLPVILLGTGIFFTLTLLQTHLSHSRSLEDSAARITALEDELRELRESQKRQAVNWSAGLGTVVRRVRDLGREVHAHDHVEHVEPVVPPEPVKPSLTQRLAAINPFRTAEVEQKGDAAAAAAAHIAGEKMDTLRETAEAKAARVKSEVTQRMDTVPARADPTTASPTLATRLLSTFGNPQTDDAKVQRDLENIKRAAGQVAGEATDTVEAAKKRLERVDANKVKESLVAAEEKVEDAVTPLAVATGQKMDSIREAATAKASDISAELEHRVDTLPARSDPATASPSLASRLFATFGNPRTDDVKAREDLRAVQATVEHLAEKAVDTAHAAKERLEHIDMGNVKQRVVAAEAKLQDAVAPLASATADKMDVLRETVTARSADLDETVRARLDALPERGIDNPSQGVDPVLASRLVATFGDPADDARLTQREIGDAVGMGNVVRAEEGIAAAKQGLNAAKDVAGEMVDQVENIVEEKRARGWWRS